MLQNLHINMTSLHEMNQTKTKTKHCPPTALNYTSFSKYPRNAYVKGKKKCDFLRIHFHFWGKILKIHAIDGGLKTSDSKVIVSLLKYAFMIKMAYFKNTYINLSKTMISDAIHSKQMSLCLSRTRLFILLHLCNSYLQFMFN